jgi:hypothetical protein
VQFHSSTHTKIVCRLLAALPRHHRFRQHALQCQRGTGRLCSKLDLNVKIDLKLCDDRHNLNLQVSQTIFSCFLRRDSFGPQIPKVVPAAASRQTRECTVNQAHEIEFDVSYLKKARQTEHQKSPVSVPTAAGSLPAWCRTHHQHELTLTDQPALFHPFVL